MANMDTAPGAAWTPRIGVLVALTGRYLNSVVNAHGFGPLHTFTVQEYLHTGGAVLRESERGTVLVVLPGDFTAVL